MTEVAQSDHVNGGLPTLAQFSPDGTKFVIAVKKGEVKQNTNRYSLLLWKTKNVFGGSFPRVLLEMTSSSNRPGIEKVSWLSDNETLVFLGENIGQKHQLFKFNIRTRALTLVTHHPTDLLAYSMTPSGDSVVYDAAEPVRDLFDDKARRHGVRVSTQWLPGLIEGVKGKYLGEDQLFVQSGHQGPRRLKLEGKPYLSLPTFSLSPDGGHLVVLTRCRNVPPEWRSYNDQILELLMSDRVAPGQYWRLFSYELIDTRTGKSRRLMNSPMRVKPWGSEVAWSPSGQSVVVTNMYLPLIGVSGEELQTRRSSAFAVEIDVLTGEVHKVSMKSLTLLAWDPRSDYLAFGSGRSTEHVPSSPDIFFRKRNGRWEELAQIPPASKRPTITLEQDMNTPPTIVATDPDAGRRALLCDLNPQLKLLKLAPVKEITWKATDGRTISGGLYYPVNFVPGTKYPLVIQTHEWSRDFFWIDGPWPTAYAAQALAGKDIMVLQVGINTKSDDTPEEGAQEVASYQGAIEYLDAQGLIDKNRVGIIGFSATCFHVEYALTHSNINLAAASITDGVDGGYFQYLLQLNSIPGDGEFSEVVNGGMPFWNDAQSWLARAPGFNLQRVHTPILITALSAEIVLGEWEWFAGLTRLGRPVDMIYIQDGMHILKKPWDRLISQQSNVDWFAFWLKQEQDPSPDTADQYLRWNELRSLQQRAVKAAPLKN